MENSKIIQSILEKYGKDRSKLIEMAFDIQESFDYIPKEVLKELCDQMGIFYSEAYSSISFFKDFRFWKPQKTEVYVCNGTSCYFNGGKELINELTNIPGIEVKTAYCYKCCAQYPVACINDQIILNANFEKIKQKITNSQ
ncbi:MAG: NAD(P)H-dependent oxidoreductase subunit E [bacterium]